MNRSTRIDATDETSSTEPAGRRGERDPEDLGVIDDDVSDFFDGDGDAHPGDRRRDPLRDTIGRIRQAT